MTEVTNGNGESVHSSEGRGEFDGVHEAVRQVCPLNEVLDRVSGKWAIGVLTLTGAEEVVRFTEYERAIPGISRRMLTLTLRNLQRDGLLDRTVYATVPPKTEYRLTEAARELARTLSLLTDWARRHQVHVHASRIDYDGGR